MRYFRAVKFLSQRMPAHVILFVTGQCNAKCRHCFYWKNIASADQGKELSLEEISRISQSLGHIKMLSLTGGEPFLRKDLAQIATVMYRNNELHHLIVHTNGLLGDRIRNFATTVVRECPNLSLTISLSLDDFEEGHDTNRGVPGLFRKVLSLIDSLQGLRRLHSNFEIDILTAVSSYNYRRTKELMDFVRNELQVDAHRLELVRGDTRDPAARSVNAEQFKDVIGYLRETWTLEKRKAKYPLASFKQVVDALTPEIEMETRIGNKMIFPCKAGRTVIVIGEQGDVYPCELLSRTFGNVRSFDHDMRRLLFSKEAIELKHWILESRCFCTWGCAIANSIIFNIRAYPRIIRKWLALKLDSLCN